MASFRRAVAASLLFPALERKLCCLCGVVRTGFAGETARQGHYLRRMTRALEPALADRHGSQDS